MGLLARIRVSRAQPVSPAPAAVSAPTAFAAVELAEDELEQVVGGLERVYVPGLFAAD